MYKIRSLKEQCYKFTFFTDTKILAGKHNIYLVDGKVIYV